MRRFCDERPSVVFSDPLASSKRLGSDYYFQRSLNDKSGSLKLLELTGYYSKGSGYMREKIIFLKSCCDDCNLRSLIK